MTMSWKEKILVGMKLINEGCKEVADENYSSCCEKCPFEPYCSDEFFDYCYEIEKEEN